MLMYHTQDEAVRKEQVLHFQRLLSMRVQVNVITYNSSKDCK